MVRTLASPESSEPLSQYGVISGVENEAENILKLFRAKFFVQFSNLLIYSYLLNYGQGIMSLSSDRNFFMFLCSRYLYCKEFLYNSAVFVLDFDTDVIIRCKIGFYRNGGIC